MTHQEAVASEAAERYLLGQLSEAECGQFEEHYFDCPECAADMRAQAILAANARAVFSSQARRAAERRNRVVVGLALAACVMLLIAFSYQVFVVVPQLKGDLARVAAPQAYPAFFLRAVARGEDQVVEVPRGSLFVGLWMDLPPGARYNAYQCRLEAASGRTVTSVAVPAPAAAGAALNLLLPASELPPGRYTLVLRAPAGHELDRFLFVIQPK